MSGSDVHGHLVLRRVDESGLLLVPFRVFSAASGPSTSPQKMALILFRTNSSADIDEAAVLETAFNQSRGVHC